MPRSNAARLRPLPLLAALLRPLPLPLLAALLRPLPLPLLASLLRPLLLGLLLPLLPPHLVLQTLRLPTFDFGIFHGDVAIDAFAHQLVSSAGADGPLALGLPGIGGSVSLNICSSSWGTCIWAVAQVQPSELSPNSSQHLPLFAWTAAPYSAPHSGTVLDSPDDLLAIIILVTVITLIIELPHTPLHCPCQRFKQVLGRLFRLDLKFPKFPKDPSYPPNPSPPAPRVGLLPTNNSNRKKQENIDCPTAPRAGISFLRHEVTNQLRVHSCACVCMCACAFACSQLCLCVYVRLRVHSCACVCACSFACSQLCLYMCVCVSFLR